MQEYDDLSSREDMLSAFEALHCESSDFFRSLPEDDFFRHPADGVWSPAENVVHLIKSVKAVASAMELPKLALAPFGRAKDGSRTYAGVREVYLAQLTGGAVAGGRYVPDTLSPSDSREASRARERALDGWERTGNSLVKALEKWSERALDRYRLPHPLLGKLTVREMLFFTHYHDLHHMGVVRRHIGDSA